MNKQEILQVVREILVEKPDQKDVQFVPDDLFYALELRWNQFKFSDEEALQIVRFLLSRVENYNSKLTCSRSEALWSLQVLRKLLSDDKSLQELFNHNIPQSEMKDIEDSLEQMDKQAPLPRQFEQLVRNRGQESV